MIDSATETCRPTETPLNFNQRGQPGPPGPAGPPGPSANPPELGGTSYADRAGKPGPVFTKKPKPLGKKVRKQLSLPKQKGVAVFSTYKDKAVNLDGDGPISQQATPVSTLPLPAGRWVIVAKSNVTSQLAYYEPAYADCTLVAGNDFDRAWSLNGTLTMTVVHRFKKPNRVDLRCGGALASMTWSKITAVRVKSIQNRPDLGS